MSLRILHVVSSLNIGGMEQFVVRLAARQQAAGDAVSIMALQGGPLVEEAARLGVPVDVLGGRSRVLRACKGLSILMRLKPDIVHGHNATSLQYALLAHNRARTKIVITWHGRGKADYREPAQDLWKRVDRVVCVSDAVTCEASGRVPADRIRVIRNGIEAAGPTRSRDVVRQELGLGDEFTAIIVARIDRLKGHETLLRGWAELARMEVTPCLLIVGDGPERLAMERLVGEQGIASSIKFLGFRSDVADLLGAADLFVLPSLTEGLPLSILEAMAHGLPVVATRVGGIPEVVGNEREGLLVDTENPQMLAAAIARIVDDSELRVRLGESARLRVRNEFSFDTMLHQYDELYHSLQVSPL